MLYFGSFNPVHRGHIALAEYVVGQGLCDEAVLVVSPQSPYKQAAELAPEMDRFEMAEIACAASKYPDRIKPSVVEFLLPKPSYTIDTLRYLKENFGSGMQFSILMGSDQIARLDGWKEYERVLDHADDLGFTQMFWQEGGAVDESFTPAFDTTGVLAPASARDSAAG